jgi:hypothetical protein
MQFTVDKWSSVKEACENLTDTNKEGYLQNSTRQSMMEGPVAMP